jgi:hypothetical protein
MSLNLTNNALTQLSVHTFDGLFQLRNLNLSSNPLKYIQNSLFKDLYNLVSLDMRNNCLKQIERMAFENANLLRDLCLQNGAYVKFDDQTFNGLQNIINVFVDYDYLNLANVISIQNSLKPTFYKNLLSISNHKSINLFRFSDI